MRTNLSRSLSRVLLFCIIILSLRVIFLCHADVYSPAGYENLFFLPTSYLIGIISLYFFLNKNTDNKNMLSNLTKLIVLGLLFLRNVVTPYFMVNDSYIGSLGLPRGSIVENAIYCVTYETLCVFALLILLQNYKFNFLKLKIKQKIKLSQNIFKPVLFMSLAIGFLILFLIPDFRGQYYTIFTEDITHLVKTKNDYDGGLNRALFTLGNIIVESLRLILPAIIIYKVAKFKQNYKSLSIVVCVVLSQCLLMNDSNAFVLMVMICHFILIYRMFPMYNGLIKKMICAFIIVFLMLLYINRFALDHYGASMSLLLQSYLPSVSNFTGVYNLYPEHDLLQFFNEIITAIPFKNFLGFSPNSKSISITWQETNNCIGQIMPNSAQSFYFFGLLFSPLLTCSLLAIAYKVNSHLLCQNNVLIFITLVYFVMYTAASPFVYNFSIYSQWFMQRMLFMLMFAYLSDYRFNN